MTRCQISGPLAATALALLLNAGCNSETKSVSTSASNSADYGENKMPPTEKVVPKAGKGAKTPGAPPLRR